MVLCIVFFLWEGGGKEERERGRVVEANGGLWLFVMVFEIVSFKKEQSSLKARRTFI